MGLIQDLGHGSIALDSVIFIYFIQEDSRFLPLVVPIFSGMENRQWQAVTSAVTLLETLVVPYRSGDMSLAQRYENLLSRSHGLTLVEIDRPILRAAARLRATVSIKTPDALQIATALSARCTSFVTNDRDLPAIPGLRVIQLSRYLKR